MIASEHELITEFRVTDHDLVVTLSDGYTFSVPLERYPSLLHASPEQRNDWRLIADGKGVRWPQIDEYLSAADLLRAKPEDLPVDGTEEPEAEKVPEPINI